MGWMNSFSHVTYQHKLITGYPDHLLRLSRAILSFLLITFLVTAVSHTPFLLLVFFG